MLDVVDVPLELCMPRDVLRDVRVMVVLEDGCAISRAMPSTDARFKTVVSWVTVSPGLISRLAALRAWPREPGVHSSRSRRGPAVVSIDCSAMADELRSFRTKGERVLGAGAGVGGGATADDSDSMRSRPGRKADVDALVGDATASSAAARREPFSEERRAGACTVSDELDDAELRRERTASMERRIESIA